MLYGRMGQWLQSCHLSFLKKKILKKKNAAWVNHSLALAFFEKNKK